MKNEKTDLGFREYLSREFYLDEKYIDEKLFKEDIEVIKLYYDKTSKWMDLHNSSVLWFSALTIAMWWKSYILTSIFALILIISILGAYNKNKELNKIFNTLLKKTRENQYK